MGSIILPRLTVKIFVDEELLELNAKIYDSIREKKMFLEKREQEIRSGQRRSKEKTTAEVRFIDLEKNKPRKSIIPDPVENLDEKSRIKYSDAPISETISVKPTLVSQPVSKNPFKKILMKFKAKKEASANAGDAGKKDTKTFLKIFKKSSK
jgi:hypothetical protein